MSVDNFTQQHDLSLFKARILLFKTKIKNGIHFGYM